MESFGLSILQENDVLEKAFLGSLGEHFKEDFVFKRFLPSTNGTIDSLNRILFYSPIIKLTSSKFQKYKIPLTAIDIYKKAGYRVVFAYAGNASWYNIAYFLKEQGVDAIIDDIVLLEQYPQAKATKHPYGIKDEYMYAKIYEVLEKATQPTLIISLTISNHPSYIHKREKALEKNLLSNEELKSFSTDANGLLNAYAYANDAFGNYLTKVKSSAFKDNIIIAATGDYSVREYKIDFNQEKAFEFSVPFYLYVSKNLQHNIYYDKNRIGSHKDIFPTLYSLSLSKTEYLSMGGKNMLGVP